ncbi:MAG: PDDEXK nuclease domain-containing protein [bacterium]|nr:PDDEXK nuclease domain-containing protein [bacterium]
MGSEHKIKLGDKYNYIDLLLFNIEFNCYVIVELKVTELREEHIGKIKVYMNYLDNNLKKVNQDKTIGIIICKKDNKYVIEYCSDNRIISREYENVITVNEDMELFECLMYLMNQQYTFSNDEILRSFQQDNIIVWYSDCYYNPDDEWSIKSVSYLTVEYVDNIFKLWCVKPLDEIIDGKQKFHCICFSPCCNGKYVKNNLNGLTLQDDFVFEIYHKLLKQEKGKKLSNKCTIV